MSIVSDEWRYRMLTPPKGNIDYVPVNAEGRRVAQEWDPAKDEAAGESCKGYGPAGLMRLPGRLHITWPDSEHAEDRDRHRHADAAVALRRRARRRGTNPPSLQGYSAAEWEFPGGRGAPGSRVSGQLKVVTTRMKPGYLRKNGVPYSAAAVLTEYVSQLTDDDDGTRYLTVTTMLDDPTYLQQPWVRTSQFRRQADAKGWNPTPCSTR